MSDDLPLPLRDDEADHLPRWLCWVIIAALCAFIWIVGTGMTLDLLGVVSW